MRIIRKWLERRWLKKRKLTINIDEQNRPPNFYGTDGKFFLVRCFACGKANSAPDVAFGQCAWCGWKQGGKNEKRKCR